MVLTMQSFLKNILLAFCGLMPLALACSARAQDRTPAFTDYPAAVVTIKQWATRPKLVTAQDREFKTRISEAFRLPANFAGHYVLSTFGCGASCLMAFAIDKKSGMVTWLPFTVCCWYNAKPDLQPLAFRADSRLVIVTGSRNEQGQGVYYYQLGNAGFGLVHQVEQTDGNR